MLTAAGVGPAVGGPAPHLVAMISAAAGAIAVVSGFACWVLARCAAAHDAAAPPRSAAPVAPPPP